MRASVLAFLAIATTVVLASKLAEANRRLDERTEEAQAFKDMNERLIVTNGQMRTSLNESKNTIVSLMSAMSKVMASNAGDVPLPTELEDTPRNSVAKRIHTYRKFVADAAAKEIMSRNARPA